MKTRLDPRHQQRAYKFKLLFALSFRGVTNGTKSESIQEIVAHIQEIDSLIAKAAPEWPVDRLNKVDLAILRLSIFELLFDRSNPPKVVIDEAVELGKEYGSESTAKFVNGVLGGLLQKENKNKES
jgi:transcription antitermination protein NusB